MRIRQIALVARELEPAVAELCEALALEVCFRDPGVETFGLHNALMAAGDTFIEVVSPVRDGTTAGRFLARRVDAGVSSSGDGGYMVLLQTDDVARDRARAEAAGVRVVWSIALPDIVACHLHPRDIGGAIVSLDQPRPSQAWRWGGPDWESRHPSPVAGAIVAAELSARDPAAMSARWAAVLGRPHARAGAGFKIALDDSELRFVAGPVEGLTGVDLAAAPGVTGRAHTLSGVRFRLVAAG